MNSSMTYKLICTTLSLKDPLIQRTFYQQKPISSSSSYSTRNSTANKHLKNIHFCPRRFISTNNKTHFVAYFTNLCHIFSCLVDTNLMKYYADIYYSLTLFY